MKEFIVPKLQILELSKENAKEMGQEHGETFREQIKEIAEIRMERMCNVSQFKKPKSVLSLASEHLPILERFDKDLYAEILGIAEGSNISVENIIVLNNYTDMRDIKNPNGPDIGGCSIIYSPSEHGPFLGLTWDIHQSALPYTILLKVKGALLLSITGCLGMAGINHQGVSLAINNLNSIDAKVGVIWPALVRKVLAKKNADEAKSEIMNASLGSGRHFAVADMDHFFGIETSAEKKKIVTDDNKKLYFHTNHCLDSEMRKTHTIPEISTTMWRYQVLDEKVRNFDLNTTEQVFMALKEVELAFGKNSPHHVATCASLVMDIKNRQMLASRGGPNIEQAIKTSI
jgi:isopenicillin-N N-acyltransferase-like protein